VPQRQGGHLKRYRNNSFKQEASDIDSSGLLEKPGKARPRAAAYIAGCWAVGGYVNTGAYSLAPRLVRPQLRAAANGLLAITYQVAHTSGLLAALALALALFGGLGPR